MARDVPLDIGGGVKVSPYTQRSGAGESATGKPDDEEARLFKEWNAYYNGDAGKTWTAVLAQLDKKYRSDPGHWARRWEEFLTTGPDSADDFQQKMKAANAPARLMSQYKNRTVTPEGETSSVRVPYDQNRVPYNLNGGGSKAFPDTPRLDYWRLHRMEDEPG